MSMRILSSIIKAARKNSCGVWLVVHGLADLDEKLQSIPNDIAIKIPFRMDETAVDEVIKRFRLTKCLVEEVTQLQRGEVLIRLPSNRVLSVKKTVVT